jgi:hypothetical protein
MELYLEFQPQRFITRFNAIQKELEAREVVYIEDEEEEEEEGEEEDGQAIEAEADAEGEEVGISPVEQGEVEGKSNQPLSVA